jgi:hypothetical protein
MKKILFVIIFLCAAFSAFAQTARLECFPFERLAPAERKKAEDLLLKALDSEALYTIVGGLKPMSSGFQSFQTAVREPRGVTEAEAAALAKKYPSEEARKNLSDEEKRKIRTAEAFFRFKNALREIEETRRILALWRCGEDSFFADVQHFHKTFDGNRFSEAVVFNRKSLREMLAARKDFFARWAITPASHPLQVLYAVETDETGARFGGYGYLFGYPDYAVNFFVAAAAEEEFTGRFVERDFYSIETFARPTNGFVWATPKNHAENEADKAIKDKAAKIFAEYKRRRAEYVGEGKKGVVEMMRDWLAN